ncbi:glycosyltransferase family 1 protein [Polynucleobacter paneuropaeus]|jgi:hypothetical protein|uniref:glycosyltransferase family protein n=1 Tax=Polynucleobacter paneuropaeus TaxID=2527775 RepID=UPI001BFE67B1|nr:glycosyltransferase [Polynucleobacter paneuropaeus]MBT8568349.1 glycosyltransferase family 1 protein [Polynucleobacter paneuropaeus]MBT8632113.1 glycosyltransferase family 1 protein [Polynucleobacter paneuropaeus]
MRTLLHAITKALHKKRKKLRQSYEKWVFQQRLHPTAQSLRQAVLQESEVALADASSHESEQACLASPDPTVRQGFLLRQALCQEFENAYRNSTQRILIHVPSSAASPAGYSLFSNLAECLSFLGVPTQILGWDDDSATVFAQFEPTLFLTSEDDSYLERVDWSSIHRYRNNHALQIGFTAPLLANDVAPNFSKIAWAKEHGIDFFYSFRDQHYLDSHPVYRELEREGFKTVSLPWGANILRYYPVAGFERDLNYVLIASRKREHIAYMASIAQRYSGFIDGPGWSHIAHFQFHRDRDRYIYSRAKVGLNVHLPEQIHTVFELNERTYQLAACGAPQLVDHPKLLDLAFSKEAVFVADSPAQFTDLFEALIHDPSLGPKAALIAQQEVFAKHTTFHRAKAFLEQIECLSKKPV